MDDLEILKNIGLSPKEAKVYLAVLKLKKGLITSIAEQAGVNRTTTYDILEYLNKKGLRTSKDLQPQKLQIQEVIVVTGDAGAPPPQFKKPLKRHVGYGGNGLSH